MNSLILLIGAIVLFTIAYLLYGRHLTKKWGIDSNRETPATRLADNRDYVPTDSRVLFGHHLLPEQAQSQDQFLLLLSAGFLSTCGVCLVQFS